VTETIIVDTPKAGEVRVKVMANALCHTDGECQAGIQAQHLPTNTSSLQRVIWAVYTLSGEDPEG
jgi:hypothetical protein